MKSKFILLAAAIALPIQFPSVIAQFCDDDGEYIGRPSANPFPADSTVNKFGAFGSSYSSTSIHNPYGAFGNPYSPTTATSASPPN